MDRKFQEQRSIHREMEHYWKNVEKALHGPIKQLKREVAEMDRSREKLEDTLPHHINKQEDTLWQTDEDELVVEESQHGQVEDLKEQEDTREQTDTDQDYEETLHGQVEELQEEDSRLEAVTEPHGVIRYQYHHLFDCVVIFFFLIYTFPVVLAYICELNN